MVKTGEVVTQTSSQTVQYRTHINCNGLEFFET